MTAFGLQAQYSAYLPEPGLLLLTPQYLYQSFNHLHAGTAKFTLADLGYQGRLKQHTVQASLEYGVHPDWAFDLSFGHVSVRFPARNQDGMTDTGIGVRYRLHDEFKTHNGLPTVALRVGAIVAGSYKVYTGLPPSNPGDGASGVETSLLLGKSLGKSGINLYGDIGFRHRGQGVPEDLFGTAGVAWEATRWLMFTAAYRHEQGLSGIDILGVGFTGDFRVVKEVNQIAEFGVVFTDRHGRSLNLFSAISLDGRNTGDKTIFGVSATLPFKLR